MAKLITSSGNVGLREFRENTALYIDAVKKGKKFTIYRHSTPVFAVVPAAEVEYDLDELDGQGWETIADFRNEKGEGIPAKKLLAALKKAYGSGSKVHP